MFYGSNLLVYDFVYKIVTDIVAFNLTALQISYSRIRKSGNHGRKSQVDFFFIFYFFPLIFKQNFPGVSCVPLLRISKYSLAPTSLHHPTRQLKNANKILSKKLFFCCLKNSQFCQHLPICHVLKPPSSSWGLSAASAQVCQNRKKEKLRDVMSLEKDFFYQGV